MEIRLDLRLKTIAELEMVKPVLKLKLYNSYDSYMMEREPAEWIVPLRPTTIEGYLGGSTYACMTDLRDHFGRLIYRKIGITYDV